MMTKNNLTGRSFNRPLSVKHVLLGMVIALAVILFFILQVDEPHPEWSKYWMIRPLLITPLAGAFGGAVFYFIINRTHNSAIKNMLLKVIGILLYLFILWVGIILGLDGTLWD